MSTILFRRHYLFPTGGHFKVWDYFRHAAASAFTPAIYFEPDSLWDASNPWLPLRRHVLQQWIPGDSDLLFLAGLDWAGLRVPERRHYRRPIINLIQDFHHADPQHLLYHSLPNRAVRICVSQELADAVLATDRVNGPVCVIPNGLDLEALPEATDRDIDVLIVGVKRPGLAQELAAALTDLRVRHLSEMLERIDYLRLLGRTHLAVTLPMHQEGFYLPALEAMAMGALVICLDAIGNRSFCRDRDNCMVAEPDVSHLLATIRAARAMDPSIRSAVIASGRRTAAQHDLRTEQQQFLRVLEQVTDLWHTSPTASVCP